jgi:nitroreductase
METTDVILLRRSVRSYTQQPIPDEYLQAILQAGMSAPSGLNLQPWYFVALKSEQVRQEFCDIMAGVSTRIAPELESRFSAHPEVAAATQHFIRTLGDAPVILLAFLMRDDYADKKTALLSVAAAVENVLLSARDRNIASCWLTAADQTGYGPQIRDRFAPGKGDLVATVTLGYTEVWPKMIARREGRAVII